MCGVGVRLGFFVRCSFSFGFRLIFFWGVFRGAPENQFFGLWVPPLETSQDQDQHERGGWQTGPSACASSKPRSI